MIKTCKDFNIEICSFCRDGKILIFNKCSIEYNYKMFDKLPYDQACLHIKDLVYSFFDYELIYVKAALKEYFPQLFNYYNKIILLS